MGEEEAITQQDKATITLLGEAVDLLRVMYGVPVTEKSAHRAQSFALIAIGYELMGIRKLMEEKTNSQTE